MASKLKKTLGTVAQFGLPILGGIFGGPGGAALGGAAGGALSGKTGSLKQAGIGAAAGYGGAKLLGLGGSNTNSGSLGASLANSFGKSSNPLSSLTSAIGGLFGGGSGSGGGVGGGMGGGSNPLTSFSGITSSGPGVNVGMGRIPQQSKTSGLFGKLTSNPLLLTGLGTMLGSQFIRSPKVPDAPQSTINFGNAINSNPLQNQAQSALMQQLGQTQKNLGQPEIDAINRQYDLSMEQERKALDSTYKSLRPGTSLEDDSSYRRDVENLNNRYATLRADSMAQAQRQISNDFSAQRVQQISQAMGLGQQQIQQLAQLSQIDLERQINQLNMDYNDKQALRDYILQLGGNITMSQIPSQNPLAQLLQGLGR